MMCIISKERIAFCAQVEGTRGEIFATSPIAFQMHAFTQWTHSDLWSQLAPTPECLFKIGDWQSEKNRWNSDWRAICNATRGIETGCGVIRHRGVSDGSDGACPLWRSLSVRTEIFFADAVDGVTSSYYLNSFYPANFTTKTKSSFHQSICLAKACIQPSMWSNISFYTVITWFSGTVYLFDIYSVQYRNGL